MSRPTTTGAMPGPWLPVWAAVRAAADELRAHRLAEGRDPETGEALAGNG